jgi:transcriptional regulator with XRE-family HTH domain
MNVWNSFAIRTGRTVFVTAMPTCSSQKIYYSGQMLQDLPLDDSIAALVRTERETRNWSLADLADHSGVSKAMISRIERGEAKPTAALLVKLATAFGLTLARFFARIERAEDRLVRCDAQPVWRDPESGYTRRQMLSVADHPIEMTAIELPPGARLNFLASSYALMTQAIWVQSGELQVTEGTERRVLKQGDCLAFGPPCDVTLANEATETCKYLVVTSRR